MNLSSKMALLYFPTTVLFIDDDTIFLSTVGLQINPNIPVVFCNKPKEALRLLLNSSHVGDVIKKSTDELNKEGIFSLYTMAYNPQRFSYISTVIVDYSMPGLNGAEFCKQIVDLPVTKIMLTAKADYQQAVQLFNNGLIDYFIIKDDSQMHNELNKVIQNAQLHYFERLCASLFSERSRIPDHIIKLLSELEFAEYYLIDNSGSVLLINYEGAPTWIIVKSIAGLENYYDIAINQDTPENIINILKTQAIPFFFNDKDFKLPAAKWEPYLHRSYPIAGVSDHYYAVIKNNPLYTLERNILAHKDYLNSDRIFSAMPNNGGCVNEGGVYYYK